MQVSKYRDSRFFAVYDAAGEIVVVTVYKRGAREVVRRLNESVTQIEETATGVADSSAAPSASLTTMTKGKRS